MTRNILNVPGMCATWYIVSKLAGKFRISLQCSLNVSQNWSSQSGAWAGIDKVECKAGCRQDCEKSGASTQTKKYKENSATCLIYFLTGRDELVGEKEKQQPDLTTNHRISSKQSKQTTSNSYTKYPTTLELSGLKPGLTCSALED